MARKFYGSAEVISTVNGTIESGGAGNVYSYTDTTFLSYLSTNYPNLLESLESSQLKISFDSSGYSVTLVLPDQTETSFGTAMTRQQVFAIGIGVNPAGTATTGDDYISLSPVYERQAKQAKTLYGPVNRQTTKLIKLYGPVEEPTLTGVTGEVRAGAMNVTGFNGTTFWTAAESQINLSKTPDYLWVNSNASGSKATLRLYYSDGTYTAISGIDTAADLSQFGISFSLSGAGTDYIDLTPVYSTQTVTKLIHQGFGHLNYS